MLQQLQHPNIVQFVGFDSKSTGFGDERQFYILTEWVPGGSIHSLLKKGIKLEEGVVKAYTRQVVMLVLVLVLISMPCSTGFMRFRIFALHGCHSQRYQMRQFAVNRNGTSEGDCAAAAAASADVAVSVLPNTAAKVADFGSAKHLETLTMKVRCMRILASMRLCCRRCAQRK